MLKDPKIDRVSLTRNWASTAHDDGANASARSHVILFGSWTGGKLLVQGRADPICEVRKWHHYDPAQKHMVTPIERGDRWSLTAFTAPDGSARRLAAAGADLQEEDEGEPAEVEEDLGAPWNAPEEAPAAEQD